jgi:hypothetical protein
VPCQAKKLRHHLFGISGIHDTYPQVFIKYASGEFKFKGDFDNMQALADSPSIAVFEEAFADALSGVGGATLETLGAVLRERAPKRFLFCGHGDLQYLGQCTLGFTGPWGVFSVMEPEHIAQLLSKRSLPRPPELVHLSGCCTLELGKACVKAGVEVVVCWETKTLDCAAAAFSSVFYREVRSGATYERAFNTAVLEMQGGDQARVGGKVASGHAAYLPKYALVDPDDDELVSRGVAIALHTDTTWTCVPRSRPPAHPSVAL